MNEQAQREDIIIFKEKEEEEEEEKKWLFTGVSVNIVKNVIVNIAHLTQWQWRQFASVGQFLIRFTIQKTNQHNGHVVTPEAAHLTIGRQTTIH